MKWITQIKGISPLLMHNYIGIPESKAAKEKSDQDQAESYSYRDKHGDLVIPVRNMRSCIIEGFVNSAGSKQKTKTKMNVSPRIKVIGGKEDLMNIKLSSQEYSIDKQSVPSGGRSGGIRDWCVRPRIDEWGAEFILEESLDISEKDLRYKLEFAGSDVGVLSNRPNGYGRFSVVSLSPLK